MHGARLVIHEACVQKLDGHLLWAAQPATATLFTAGIGADGATGVAAAGEVGRPDPRLLSTGGGAAPEDREMMLARLGTPWYSTNS